MISPCGVTLFPAASCTLPPPVGRLRSGKKREGKKTPQEWIGSLSLGACQWINVGATRGRCGPWVTERSPPSGSPSAHGPGHISKASPAGHGCLMPLAHDTPVGASTFSSLFFGMHLHTFSYICVRKLILVVSVQYVSEHLRVRGVNY